MVLLIAAVLGSIYSGVATATEAAAAFEHQGAGAGARRQQVEQDHPVRPRILDGRRTQVIVTPTWKNTP